MGTALCRGKRNRRWQGPALPLQTPPQGQVDAESPVDGQFPSLWVSGCCAWVFSSLPRACSLPEARREMTNSRHPCPGMTSTETITWYWSDKRNHHLTVHLTVWPQGWIGLGQRTGSRIAGLGWTPLSPACLWVCVKTHTLGDVLGMLLKWKRLTAVLKL